MRKSYFRALRNAQIKKKNSNQNLLFLIKIYQTLRYNIRSGLVRFYYPIWCYYGVILFAKRKTYTEQHLIILEIFIHVLGTRESLRLKLMKM